MASAMGNYPYNQNQTATNLVKEPDTLNAMLTGLDREVAHANSVLERVTEVADKLLGGEPREVSNATDNPEPGSLVQRMRLRQQRLFTVLSQIDEQVARIGDAI